MVKLEITQIYDNLVERGDPMVCTLDEFIEANSEGFSESTIEAIRALEPGESILIGGGVSPMFEVRRLPAEAPTVRSANVGLSPEDAAHYRDIVVEISPRLDRLDARLRDFGVVCSPGSPIHEIVEELAQIAQIATPLTPLETEDD